MRLVHYKLIVLFLSAETAGWHNTTGRFISVIGATNCCANNKTPEGVSPSAHLADGFIDLVVVRHTSRVQYLRHMIRLAGRADHVRIRNLKPECFFDFVPGINTTMGYFFHFFL